jgi:hypothetical protein
MAGHHAEPTGAESPVAPELPESPVTPGPAKTVLVAVRGCPPQGDMLAGVVAGLARRDDVVVICDLPMVRSATESTCLIGLLHAAMPQRAIAVVPIRPCPAVPEADVALIETLCRRRVVVLVVVAAPVADLLPVAEQLRSQLGAGELALAEESSAGLIMQRIRGYSATC